MSITVREHVTVPARPWHSIVIDVDVPGDSRRLYWNDPEIQHLVDLKNHLRGVLRKIVGIVKISRQHTCVKSNRQGYSGYIFVYQGDGTEEEHKKFILAMKLTRKYASRLRSSITRQEKRT